MARGLRHTVTVIGCAAALQVNVAGAQTAAPAPDSSKQVAIRRLLELQRTDSQMLSGIALAMPADAPVDPNLPAGFRDAFLSMVRRDIGQFIERLVPVYDSLYTAADVSALIQFYQTPIGRKYLDTQPALAASLSALARQWGMEMAGKVIVEMSRRPPGRP
jgi:hypothetical protein